MKKYPLFIYLLLFELSLAYCQGTTYSSRPRIDCPFDNSPFDGYSITFSTHPSKFFYKNYNILSQDEYDILSRQEGMSFKYLIDVENAKIVNINLVINDLKSRLIDDSLVYKLEETLLENSKIISIKDMKEKIRKPDSPKLRCYYMGFSVRNEKKPRRKI